MNCNVKTGHSLGAAVASLIALEWATHVQNGSSIKATSCLFVTSQKSGLPPGRPIHCYGYGSPGIVDLATSQSATGLSTVLLNSDDIVPSLSVGLVRDLKLAAAHLLDPAHKGLCERIVARTVGWGSTSAKTTTVEGGGGEGEIASIERSEEDFLLTTLQQLRTKMNHERLYVCGDVYWMQATETGKVWDLTSIYNIHLLSCHELGAATNYRESKHLSLPRCSRYFYRASVFRAYDDAPYPLLI